jgi:hypothetical protein
VSMTRIANGFVSMTRSLNLISMILDMRGCRPHAVRAST